MKRKEKLYHLAILILLALLLTSCGSKSERAKKIMEKHLLEKYGEEFVVRYVGRRSAGGDKFYEGEIFPKSIIGTPRENDKYYYASASVDVLFGGFLDREAGDSYSYIKRNDDVEEYLLPKAKELFGEMIRMKVDAQHKVTAHLDYKARPEELLWIGKKTASFEQMRSEVEGDPEHERMILDIDIYIFDRIDDDEEEEKRKEEIFYFIQYLKKEGLFKYLRMYIEIVDERVLTPSYRQYRKSEDIVDQETILVEDSKVKIPNKKFRLEMSKVLSEELKNTSQEVLYKNMSNILKSELGLDSKINRTDIEGGSLQYISEIQSKRSLILYNDFNKLTLEEKKKLNYENIEDIDLDYLTRFILY